MAELIHPIGGPVTIGSLDLLSGGAGGMPTISDPFTPPAQEPTAAEREKADSVALEAHGLVHGDRNVDYGHPLDDFSKTAEFWTTYLQGKGILPDDKAVAAEDVGMMMVLLKVSREMFRHKRDNLTDGCGYFETVHRVLTERDRREAIDDDVRQDVREIARALGWRGDDVREVLE